MSENGSAEQFLGIGADAGKQVLTYAVDQARTLWGERLIAAYALGSLAHGGFSIHVSDVDLGLVLADPLDASDAASVSELSSAVKSSGEPLTDRLSVFWGSAATLSGKAAGGRFPPLDRLDLKQFGRLLAGRDVRAELGSPTLQELVIASARHALRYVARPEVKDLLRDPVALANAGTKPLTRLVLYPVRFLFTARTGQVGMNDAAVRHFVTTDNSHAAALARKALEWRFEPPGPGGPSVVELLREGLLPLYQIFLADYEQRLREYGERDLAQAFSDWRARLAIGNS